MDEWLKDHMTPENIIRYFNLANQQTIAEQRDDPWNLGDVFGIDVNKAYQQGITDAEIIAARTINKLHTQLLALFGILEGSDVKMTLEVPHVRDIR